MVSYINKRQSDQPAMVQAREIYKEIGFRGLWTGLGARIFMVGSFAAVQWWIYDSFKVFCGLQTTGGAQKK